MFSRNELLDAIEDLESNPSTYQNCQKLATFYMLYDHLYGVDGTSASSGIDRLTVVDRYGDGDFFDAIEGSEADKVFSVLSELMDTVRVLQPRLYDATLTALRDL